jgi:leader peptidase (prepilin peptidase) / N-methyltransferase
MTSDALLAPSAALPLLAPLVAVVGACIGSFLNVVVWRLPREESLLFPGSHCPRCGASLAWFENVPLLSWLLLRGRCRHCQAPIAVRYPLVELLTAGLWVAMLFARPAAMGPDPSPWLLLAAGWLLASWLLPLALIDLDSLWLPEPLCRWGVLLGLAATASRWENSSALAEKAMGRPALGLGDAKLAALMGAWLGPLGLGLAVSLSVLGGALIGGLARLSGRLGRQQPFPFGPFLAAAALAVWIGGHGPWLRLWGLGL